MRRNAKYCCSTITILLAAVLIHAQFAGTPVNQWTSAPEMSLARAAACSVRLPDGRVVVAGGISTSGAVGSVDLYATDGSLKSATPMLEPRANSACIAMADGRVLVTGGRGALGALQSAEIYDPMADSWTFAGQMSVARSGHTATESPWGAVILIGGEPTGTVEEYLTNGEFTTVGKLKTPRADYAIAALADHTVLVFGGSDGTSALDTVEAFNADQNEVAPAGTMLSARKNFAATLLYDGTVLLSGGYDRQGNILGSTEIFDPAKLTSVEGPALSEPRANHTAYILPNNGSVILVGGAGANGTLSSTEIYAPWNGKFGTPIPMHAARSGMASALLSRGGLMVAGGKSDAGFVSGVEQYRFSTIETGKLDYHPGEVAAFSGSGWKAGEQVLLQVQAFPLDQHNIEFTGVTTASSTGQIASGGFNIDKSHLGAKFLLTATGSQSKAQTLFTDGTDATNTTIVVTPATNTYGTGFTVSGTVADTANAAIAVDGTVNISIDGAAATGVTLNSAVTPSTYSQAYPGSAISPTTANHTIQATYTPAACGNCEAASTSLSASYTINDTTTISVATPAGGMLGTTINLSATVTPGNAYPAASFTGGSVTFRILNPSSVVIQTLGPFALPGSGGLVTTSSSILPAGTYTVSASYTPAGGSGFAGSSGTSGTSFNVAKGDATVTSGKVSATPPAPAAGQAVTLTGTVTGVAGIVPTGTVTFRDAVTPIASNVPLVNGVATITYSGLSSAGSPHSIKLDYTGDANYFGEYGGIGTFGADGFNNPQNPLSLSVGLVATTATVTTSPGTPVAFGSSYTFMGSVSPNTATNLSLGGSATLFADGLAPANQITGCVGIGVISGTFTCTNTGTPLAVGPHQIHIHYLGDGASGNFAPSNNDAGPYALSITAASTTIAVTASASTINLGQTDTYTATLNIANATPVPAGSTIAITDNGTVVCTLNGTLTALGSNSYQGVCAAVTYDGSTGKGPGTHSVYASYTSGDLTTSNSTSQLTPITITVNPATLTFGALSTLPASPTTYGTAATLSIPYTLTGTVTPALSANIQVLDGLTVIGTIAAPVGASPVSFPLPTSVTIAVGAHTLAARYIAGDANYNPTTSASLSFNVNKATAAFSAFNFSGGAFGTPVTLGASLSTAAGAGTASPSGSLTFSFAGTTLGTCTLAAGTCSVTPQYKGTVLTVPLSPETIKTDYSGDANYTTATDSSHTLSVVQNSLTGTLTASPVSPVSAGTPVTFTATLTPAGSGAGFPTGTVTFTDSLSGVTLGTGTLNSGVATLTTSAITGNTSSRTITANYPGDANFAGAAPALTYLVNPATASVVLTPSTLSVPLGTGAGSSVTYTYTITGGPANTLPTGSVTIKDSGNTINNGSGTCAITGNSFSGGSGNSATGTCTVVYDGSNPDKAMGAHIITAVYAPSGASLGMLAAGTSAAQTVTVTTGAAVTVSLIPSLNPAALGQTVTYNVSVSGGPTPPTGSVTIADSLGAIPSCSALTPLVSGAGNTSAISCNVAYNGGDAAHGVGTHNLVATYTPTLGSTNWGPSPIASPVVAEVVNKAATSVALPAFTGSLTYGNNLTFSTVVTPAPATPVFTANLQFYDNGTALGTAVTPNSTTGAATFTTTTPLLAGSHAITAAYLGDTSYAASAISPSLAIAIAKATPSPVTLSGPAPPYAVTYAGSSINGGTPLTTGVTNVPIVAAGKIPTGTVTISSGAVAIATGTLDANGNFTFINAAMPATINAGTGQNLTATYNGDSNYNGATFNASAGLTVNAANSTAVVTSAPASPVANGQSVTFLATLSGAGNPATGTINFRVDGNAISAACTGAAVTNNLASCTVAANSANNLGAGNHTITVNTFSEANGDHVLAAPASVTALANFVVGSGTAAPQISVASSLNPSPYGTGVTFSATVTGLAGGAAPVGQLQFLDGGVAIGALQPIVTSAVNVVTYSLTVPAGALAVLTGGTHAITANYIPLTPGSIADPNYGPGSSQTQTPPSILQQVVNRAGSATSAITVTANPSTIVYGQPVTFQVTVSPSPVLNNAGAPTGKVQFFDAGTAIGSPVTLDNTSSATLVGYSNLAVGAHAALTATYLGDTNFNGSSSPAAAVTVNRDQTLTVLTVPAIPTPAFGAQITLTAKVCGLAPGSSTVCATLTGNGPNGSVTFYDNGPTGSILGTVAVDNTGSASLTAVLQNPPFVATAGTVVGTPSHTITAVYNVSNSDPNFAGSTSAPQTLTIGKAASTTSVTSSANPSVTGQPVVFTATIGQSGSQGAPPSGTVTFLDGGVALSSPIALTVSGGTAGASLTVPSGGLSALSVGNHNISAQYSGDVNYSSSSTPAAPGGLVQVVNKAATSTALQSSIGTSQVTLIGTVTVNSPGAGAPTGTVQFINASVPTQPTVIGTAPVVGTTTGGVTTYVATLLVNGPGQPQIPQGNQTLDAIYLGDSNFLTSTSAILSQSLQKTATDITVASSLNPSILGNQVSIAISVFPVAPGTGTPTGQIQIFDGGSLLGTATLQGGQYQYVTSSLAVGSHAIGAAYLGDANFLPFTSPSIQQVVNKIPSSLSLSSNPPTAVLGQALTFTAVLSPTPQSQYFATGQVNFYDGSNLIGSGNLQSNIATFTISNLTVGSHQISAIYAGDSNWVGATSGSYSQTISPATASMQIGSSANPSVYGQPVTFTVTATVPSPGTVPATATVQLFDNNNAVGSPQGGSNGVFSFTVSSGGFAPGTHSISAQFVGNGGVAGSQTASLSQVVNKAATITGLVATLGSTSGSSPNQQISLTAVIGVLSPGAGSPSGTVQFVDAILGQVLGTAPVQLIGGVYTATLTISVPAQSASSEVVTATYSGDGNFIGSSATTQSQLVAGSPITAVNGAGFTSTGFAPDSWVTIFGASLATKPLTAVVTPYPTSLGGTTVSLTDANGTQRPVSIYYVSPGQINALIPSNSAIGTANLIVTNPSGAISSVFIPITRTAPGIFSANASGQGVAAALVQRVKSDGSQTVEPVAGYDSAQGKMLALPIAAAGADTIYMELYGTGIRYATATANVTCTINGVAVPVLYASVAPGYFGLDQVNVKVPASMTGSGAVNVVLTVDGQVSNTVTLTFK